MAPHAITVDTNETTGPLVRPFLDGTKLYPCFLNLSVKNRMANKRSLAELIPWVQQRASKTVVVVGDFQHRHNLIALRGLSPSAALSKAMSYGARTIRVAERLIDEIGASETVCVSSAADFIETQECNSILAAVCDYHSRGGRFAAHTAEAATGYLNRLPKTLPVDRSPMTLDRLVSYLLEEVAMFIHLGRCGYQTEVYPGPDLPILRHIASGSYFGFPFTWPNRTHISVNVGRNAATGEIL